MPKVIIAIRKEELKPWLFINNIRHDVFFDHETRVRLLETAIKNFDNDLEVTAEKFKDHPYGAYLWVFTSDFFRGEETYSLIRYHYLKAMFSHLRSEHGIDAISIETWIPANVRKFINALGVKTQYNAIRYSYSWIKIHSGGIYRFLGSLLKNTAFLFKKRSKSHLGVIADTNTSFTSHRYDSIERIIAKYPQIKFFSGQEHPLENIPENDAVVFRKELNLGLFFQSVAKAMRLSRFVLKNKRNIPFDLFCNLAHPNQLIIWYDLIIFEKCVQRYLDSNKIRKIFHVSTLTKPTYRILMKEANMRGIEFTLVASRTLMFHRSSERLLNCDVNQYNETALPDRLILKDEYSKRVLQKYPSLQNRVTIAGRYATPELTEIPDDKPLAVLIMFNHVGALCYKLINEILSAGAPALTKTIIFRCHPAYILSDNEMKKYFPDNHIINITGKDYSELKNYCTVTISGATTGALDAVQAGTVLLWVPYIWDDGILMDDMMNKIGLNCKNQEELKEYANTLLSDKRKILRQFQMDKTFLKDNFNTNRLISEVI